MGVASVGRDSGMATPEDFEALRQAIVERRAELSKRLTQIAAYSLDHPDEIAFGTVASISAAANVQPSALIRFSQAFGFDGFSALQQLFRARLRDRNSNYQERLQALEDDRASGNTAIVRGFLNAARQSIDGLSASIDYQVFDRAVDRLAGAETIYLVAKRRAAPISTYMAYAFGKLGIRTVLTGNAAGLDEDIAGFAGAGDVAMAISYAPYAGETSAQARAFAARGVPLVAMTDSALSPLAEYATEWLEIAETDHSGFRSLSASMALAMAITVAVAERRRHAE